MFLNTLDRQFVFIKKIKKLKIVCNLLFDKISYRSLKYLAFVLPLISVTSPEGHTTVVG
jgi:hypothetical protein